MIVLSNIPEHLNSDGHCVPMLHHVAPAPKVSIFLTRQSMLTLYSSLVGPRDTLKNVIDTEWAGVRAAMTEQQG